MELQEGVLAYHDDVVNAWELLYKGVVDDYVTERKAKIKADSLPWFTTELRKLLNKRFKLLKECQNTKDPQTHILYKKARNLAKKKLKAAETNYWKAEFEKATNPTQFWKVVRKVQRKKEIGQIGPIADKDKQLQTDDLVKAEIMNDYFSSVGKTLAQNFSEQEHQYNHITSVTPILQNISVDTTFLRTQLTTIKPDKATGPDKVRPKDLNIAGESMKEGINIILQRSITERKYPSKWKTAKMKVAYKKGETTDPSNYRPLSMLSVPSKIFEGQICKHIDNHMEEHELQTDRQWGYRKNRSTETLLLLLTETWKQALDLGKVVGVLFVDFHKAFDTVDHTILQQKLQAVSISGNLYDLLVDYLSNRHQFAHINGASSKIRIVEYGVPQGSLLGPRLFKIYVNDLPGSVKEGWIFLFADDTTIYYIGDDVENVVDGLNRIAGELYQWCIKNKLTVNTDKTEAMLITAKPFVGPLRKLSFGNDNIKFVNVSRTLGVYIDSQLKWNKQVNMVAKSYSAKLSQLKRLRYLPKSVLEKIYYQSIVAGVVYCMPVWGTCSPSQFNELELIHERAARIIFNLPKNVNVLQKANWRPLEYIYKKRVATLMQDIYYENAPTDLLNLFEKQSQTRTRQKHGFEIFRPKTEIGRTALRYRGPITWNALPTETKKCKDRTTF